MIYLHSLSLAKRLNLRELAFKQGQINIILGPNGAGKSSLLEVISKNEEAYEGSVRIENREIKEIALSDHAQALAYIPQKLDWNMGLWVRDIILFGLYPFNQSGEMTPQSQDQERFDYLVQALELTRFLKRPFGKLSGGEQKRVAIASALFQNTKIIVMDEPFAALDPLYKQMVADVLKKWQREKQVTMIFSIHDLYIAKYIGDYFFGLKAGALIHHSEELSLSFLQDLYDTPFLPFTFDKEKVFLPTLKGDHHE